MGANLCITVIYSVYLICAHVYILSLLESWLGLNLTTCTMYICACICVSNGRGNDQHLSFVFILFINKRGRPPCAGAFMSLCALMPWVFMSLRYPSTLISRLASPWTIGYSGGWWMSVLRELTSNFDKIRICWYNKTLRHWDTERNKERKKNWSVYK